MNILINLKDCDLTGIQSYLSTETMYDYYGDYSIPYQELTFMFSNGVNVDIKLGEDTGDFCYIASFFYNRNFSDMTKDEFLDSFTEYTRGKITNVSKSVPKS